jgi:lysophospholipase L1-like esterase
MRFSHKLFKQFIYLPTRFVAPLVVMLVVAGMALHLLMLSHAASLVVTSQPENGSIIPPAYATADVTASGGQAIVFSDGPAVPVKVMPLGDSITYGVGGTGGYRVRLWQQLVQNDKGKIDLVGSNLSGPTELGDKNHEGHPGFCMELPCDKGSMIDNLNTWLTLNSPDIILLHGGTNDIAFTSGDATLTTTHLDNLLGAIYAKKPSVVVIVAKIIQRYDSTSLNTATTQYNNAIPGLITKYQYQGRKIQLVDMTNKLVQADYADVKHPNQTGYDKMADVWYPAVSAAYHNF